MFKFSQVVFGVFIFSCMLFCSSLKGQEVDSSEKRETEVSNWFDFSDWNPFGKVLDAEEKVAYPENGILDLSCVDIEVTDETLDQLSNFSSIHTLDLSNTKVTENGVSNLWFFFPYLRTLTLSHFSISNACIRSFGKLSKLKELNLEDCHIPVEQLKALFTMGNNLQKLNLKNVVTRGYYREIKNLKNIQDINLSGNMRFYPFDLEHLIPLKDTLKRLDISNTSIFGSEWPWDYGSSTIKQICFLQNLEYLNLKSTNVKDHNIQALASLKKLKSIVLDGVSLSSKCIMHLGEIKQCEEIDFDGLKLKLVDLSSLRALSQLKCLKGLGGLDGHINVETISTLKEMFPQLESLDFGSKEISSQARTEIDKLKGKNLN